MIAFKSPSISSTSYPHSYHQQGWGSEHNNFSKSNSKRESKKNSLTAYRTQSTEFLSCLTVTSSEFFKNFSHYASIRLGTLTIAINQKLCRHNLSDPNHEKKTELTSFTLQYFHQVCRMAFLRSQRKGAVDTIITRRTLGFFSPRSWIWLIGSPTVTLEIGQTILPWISRTLIRKGRRSGWSGITGSTEGFRFINSRSTPISRTTSWKSLYLREMPITIVKFGGGRCSVSPSQNFWKKVAFKIWLRYKQFTISSLSFSFFVFRDFIVNLPFSPSFCYFLHLNNYNLWIIVNERKKWRRA